MSRFDFHSVSAARQRRLLWIGRVVVVGFACFCAVYYGALFVRGKYQDWFHLFHAMQAVMQGINPYEAGIKCYMYPPMFAVVFSPLGLLSEGVSGFVFACMSAALLVLALVWISRETCRLLGLEFDPWRVWAVAATGLLFNVDKLRAVIYSGQSDHVILALLAGAFITVRKRPFVAGVLLGLSAVIKFQTVAFLAYFAVRRRWRECMGMLTGIAAGLLVGVPVFGWTTNWQYVIAGGQSAGGCGCARCQPADMVGERVDTECGRSHDGLSGEHRAARSDCRRLCGRMRGRGRMDLSPRRRCTVRGARRRE
jgi:hypothetical protein